MVFRLVNEHNVIECIICNLVLDCWPTCMGRIKMGIIGKIKKKELLERIISKFKSIIYSSLSVMKEFSLCIGKSSLEVMTTLTKNGVFGYQKLYRKQNWKPVIEIQFSKISLRQLTGCQVWHMKSSSNLSFINNLSSMHIIIIL